MTPDTIHSMPETEAATASRAGAAAEGGHR